MGDAVAFIVENGRIDIIWIEDELMLETRASYAKNNCAALQLWLGEDTYEVYISPQGNRGRNLLTREVYDVRVQSTMRHTGPAGR